MTAGMKLDLHVHSRYSPDGRASIEQLVARLPYTGLRGFALTDHNTVAGHGTLAALRSSGSTYWFLRGVEVSTQEGHLLAYGVDAAPPHHRPVLETIEWVRDHGGEAVLAHPFRWTHGVGRKVAESAPVRAIETRNGHNSEVANAKAELVAAHRGVGAVGGSDVHAVEELGRTYTYFPEDVAGGDDLLEAMRKGRTQAGGRSLSLPNRMRVGVTSGVRFVARGLRPI